MPEFCLALAFSVISSMLPAHRPAPAIPPKPPMAPEVPWSTRVLAGTPDSLVAMGFRDDGIRRTLGRSLDLDWANLKSRVALFGPVCNIPLQRSGWETEESLKFNLNRSLFLVGRVGANSEWVESQQYKVVGVTGVGLKLPIGGELQVRGGRSLTNYDPDDLVLIPEQAKTFIEFTTRWSLPGSLNLEFTSETVPDQPNVSRDLKLAMPLPKSGEIHVGARYSYEGETTPWIDRMKLYFGLQLKR